MPHPPDLLTCGLSEDSTATLALRRRDGIQFAAGTSLDQARGDLRIAFGVADCVAAETLVKVADVEAMLRGELVIARL